MAEINIYGTLNAATGDAIIAKAEQVKYGDTTVAAELEDIKNRERGPEGPMGPQGPQGEKGEKGDTGDPFTYEDFTPEQLEALRGPEGPMGPQGPQGLKGATGSRGPQGPLGPTGPQGTMGPIGPRGLQGVQGEQGEKGDPFTYEDFTPEQLEALRGPQGEQGIQGEKGEKGDTGEKGEKGDKGDKGEKGDIGPQGPKGDKGDQGPAGSISNIDGMSGVIPIHPEGQNTIIPYITNDLAFIRQRGYSCKYYWGTYSSDLDWTNDNIGEQLNLQFDNNSNTDNLFDGSPIYFYCTKTIDGVNKGIGPNDVMMFELTTPNFQYGRKFYINFGTTGWRFYNCMVFVKYETTGYNDVWENVFTKNNNGNIDIYGSLSGHRPIKSDGTIDSTPRHNKMRIVLWGNNNTSESNSSSRIAQIGLISYSSQGTRMTYMSRGMDDVVYRNISPFGNYNYNLGSNNNKWNCFYGKYIKLGNTLFDESQLKALLSLLPSTLSLDEDEDN